MLISKALSLIPIVALLATPGRSQHVDRIERERAQVMLRVVASDVRKYYYDPKLHDIDWDTKVRNAKQKIANATSRETLLLEIAAVLEALDDSQTFFVPPSDPIAQDYDWRYQMVGSRCYVTHLRSRSDAETKGLRPGYEVLSINGIAPTRESLGKMKYVLNVLLPQPSLRVELRDQAGEIHKVEVLARVRQAKTLTDLNNFVGIDAWRLRLERENQQRLLRPQYRELGKELMVLKLPLLSPRDLDAQRMIDKTHEHDCLIVDMRSGQGGGESTLQDLLNTAFKARPSPRRVAIEGAGGNDQSTLEYLLGSMFNRDVKIVDRAERETTTAVIARNKHHNFFAGRLIVLADSESASDAELFARVIQIERRGMVLGDRTSGRTMEAKYYGHQMGTDTLFAYGTSIATAALTMSDGKSLGHSGVTPDETILPTAADLASGRDPVMARAAEILGIGLSPEEAGKLFTYEWPMR